jgi:proteasome lid subunit RPN8/RPN11
VPSRNGTPISTTPRWRDYYAELVAEARAQGRDPQPKFVAWAEGREVEPGELEAWQRRLEQRLGNGGSGKDLWGSRSRSFEPSTRPATRRPPWYLPTRSEETSRRSRPDTSPELCETGSGFRIELSPGVCTAIEREIVAAMWQFESREIETGGYLYGFWPPDDDRVKIAHASGPGPTGEHGSGRVRLSDPSQVEADFAEHLVRAKLVRVADWHSHPWRYPIPSAADIRNWARASEEADVFPYAGVIAMPGEDVGWMAAQFAGWVIREDDNGVLVCEPAVVEER